MFTYFERLKAVKILINNGMRYTQTIMQLGYPNSRNTLRAWYREFCKKGDLHKNYERSNRYSDEEKLAVLDYYFSNGEHIVETIVHMGYPSKQTFYKWLSELYPARNHVCKTETSVVKCLKEKKEGEPVKGVAKKHSAKESSHIEVLVSSGSMDNKESFKNPYHSFATLMESIPLKSTDNEKQLRAEIEKLKEEKASLHKEVYKLKFEKDIYEKALEILKKDQGVSLALLKNREKTVLIDALRDKYKLRELLEYFGIPKSSYCYQVNAMKKPDKYSKETTEIKKIFNESGNTYGYRRVNAVLKRKGIILSDKIVIRIMKNEELTVKVKKKKKYNSYKGEITPAVENVIARDFHSKKPNEKWLTDITEFHLPAGRVYLSPIIDCFDGLPVSWSIGISPDSELSNSMLKSAISTLKPDEKPIVHSDRGVHYRCNEWIRIMEENGLTRSMSKKGCSPDNAACEGFFGRLKNEMFYNRIWQDVSLKEFMEILDSYMRWYCETRIKMSLGGLSPMEYRRKLGLAA